MSPLGGQSSLRVLSESHSSSATQLELAMWGGDAVVGDKGPGMSIWTPAQVVNLFVSASLFAPASTKRSAVDNWGNVKMPASMHLPNTTASTKDPTLSSYPWTTDFVPDRTTYSSLIGIPIFHVPTADMSNFYFEWPIFDADCRWEQQSYIDWCESSKNQTATASNRTCGSESDFRASFIMNSSLERANSSTFDQSRNPIKLFTSISSVDTDHSGANLSMNCNIRSTRVEAQVRCEGHNCAVLRMRKVANSEPDYFNPVSPAFCQACIRSPFRLGYRTGSV